MRNDKNQLKEIIIIIIINRKKKSSLRREKERCRKNYKGKKEKDKMFSIKVV